MKFTKTIVCLALLVFVSCRALEEDAEQTIGWGKVAAAEDSMERPALKMAEDDQSLGLGLEEDNIESLRI